MSKKQEILFDTIRWFGKKYKRKDWENIQTTFGVPLTLEVIAVNCFIDEINNEHAQIIRHHLKYLRTEGRLDV